MEDKTIQFAYATPLLAAVIQSKGCSNLDECVDITVQLLAKLGEKLQ